MTLAITVSATTPRPEATTTTADEDDEDELAHIERATEVLGFDPRRFFDEPLETSVRGKLNPVERMASIIRGLDRKEAVASLMAVERNLDRGPRDEVLGMLQDRMAFLDEHGERPDLLTSSIDERPARFEPARNRVVPPKEVYIVERDENGDVVDRTPYHEKRSSSASAKLSDLRSEEGST